MKLLLDLNLSHKLPRLLADLCPGSTQVRLLDLGQADDKHIWGQAAASDYTIVSLDVDFAEVAQLHRLQRSFGSVAAISRPRS